jgi:amino acid adenylation domain-containing protein
MNVGNEGAFMMSIGGTPGSGTAASRLLAALAVVLNRYSDRSELVVGYANGTGDLPVALRLSLVPEPSFAELVGLVEKAISEATVDGAATDGAAEDEGPEVIVGIDRDPPAGASYACWLTATTGPEGLHLQLHRDGGAVAGHTGDGLLGHLGTILRAVDDDPDRLVGALPVATEAELDQLLVQWNDTATPYPTCCLHELVEQQTRATPDAIAVEFEGEGLTYAELDARANQLAHHLIGLGVGPDVLVGICIERSLEMLVGLLGILKAGGAYVPVDPAYPAERQEFMLTNSQAPVVVTQESLASGLPVQDVHVVCLDRDWPAIASQPREAPKTDVAPEHLTYVIYTSGSTGQPKGVQIPHRAIVNFQITMAERPGLNASDVLVAVTTLSFDIAGLELFLPLIRGARVVIAASDTAADPRALAQLLEQSGATVMQATPTTWRMLADAGWTPRPGTKALCGGEALPVALADRLVGLGLELWNMYGPTETTVWSTCALIDTQGQPLTIGRPIANTTLYILDRNLQPVPVGVAGELWIGGDGLARGYRGRPDLTEERFIPHPFDPSPGARIYRTGDLACYRADGAVDFLGRIDHQVKVRGFRIELGEIETVLTRHPGIKEAVVVARGEAGEAELAAYVIVKDGPVAAHELRQYLMQTLPAYMIPQTVTTLEAFPLTPNGKVDRKALPEPTRERSSERELVAPRTELERRLTAIWERELEIRPIGVTDNFFDLGVTSYAAAALFAAIEHELGNALPLGAIFSAPTIESLAAVLEGGAKASRWTSLVAIQPAGTQQPIFCVHGGAGTILHLADLARCLGDDQPFYGLQSRGLYGGAPPLQSVPDMATHYLAEMREVHPGGPWRLAGYCFGTIVAFEIAERLVANAEEVELLTMFNGPSPAWIRQWGWYGNQPLWRERHGEPPRPTVEQRRQIRRRRRVDMLISVLRRIPRGLRQPRRLLRGIAWYTRKPRTRLLLALGRPVPEHLREEYFFNLHSKAEKAYEPTPYSGDLLIFYGEGLYENPTLGWDGLAQGGIQSFAVPGEHEGNREAMHEPAVGFVADTLQEYLARTGSVAARAKAQAQ